MTLKSATLLLFGGIGSFLVVIAGIASFGGVSGAKNIEANGSSFCFKSIPKRSEAVNCTSNALCSELISPGNKVRHGECGFFGECVTKGSVENEYCKDACSSSQCGKLCLQIYNTKTSKYCIKTRDHPNTISQIHSFLTKNNFFCVCQVY